MNVKAESKLPINSNPSSKKLQAFNQSFFDIHATDSKEAKDKNYWN
jgi:hypothetical protein